MTYIKSSPAATRLQILTTQQTPNTLSVPLSIPSPSVDQIIIARTIIAALTDFIFSANQAGRAILAAFSNAPGSTANMTISAQNGEIISGPVTALNPVPAQTYILQPGESLTVANTGNAIWAQVL